MIETLISAVAEVTRLYLFKANEPFNFNFVLIVIEKDTLVNTTNLTSPKSASDGISVALNSFGVSRTIGLDILKSFDRIEQIVLLCLLYKIKFYIV